MTNLPTTDPYGEPSWQAERQALLRRIAELETTFAMYQRLESALHESTARFREAFDYAAIGIALVSLDGHWLAVNPALCALVGYSAEELLATTYQAITHPGDLGADTDFVRQMLAGEIPTYQMEKRYIHKDGQLLWVLLSVSLVRDQAGRPRYFISQIQDITARHRLEAERETLIAQLRETVNRTNALYTVTALASSSHELDVLLRTVVTTAANVLPADRTVLISVDLALRMVTHQVEGGPGAQHVPPLSFAELWAGLSGEVLRTGEAVISSGGVPDPREDPAVQRRRIRDQAGSILVVPIQSHAAMLGTLTAINPPGRVEFTARDRDLLLALASQAATAIARVGLVVELEQRATIDELTQVFNRRTWLEHARRLVALAQRSNQPTSVIFLDVDYFKLVNDTYGHGAGDLALQSIAHQCQRQMRLGDLVGRYGGEEFAILLPNTDQEQASVVAERLRRAIESAPAEYDGQWLHLTISQGVATMAGHDADLTTLLARADQALYAAKRDGRNLVRHAEG